MLNLVLINCFDVFFVMLNLEFICVLFLNMSSCFLLAFEFPFSLLSLLLCFI
ncbi:hypothetical protein HanIR_Chr10g0468361 [Helianthus annuus]|nr:hypothetical protein HanIR_Chr10g0468361 [Helianthus annuus]